MPSEKWQAIDLWSYLEADIKFFSEGQGTVNMEKKTLYDLKLFKEFLIQVKTKGENFKKFLLPNLPIVGIQYTFKHLKKYILFVLQVYF